MQFNAQSISPLGRIKENKDIRLLYELRTGQFMNLFEGRANFYSLLVVLRGSYQVVLLLLIIIMGPLNHHPLA